MTYIVKIYFPHNNVNDIQKLIDEQCIDNDIEKENILLCDDYDLDRVIKIIKKHKIEFNVIYRERNNEPTFIEKCMNNQETPENIDAYIEQWHNSQSNKSLSEFLGMTENEYALYLETNRDIINKIIKQRGDK